MSPTPEQIEQAGYYLALARHRRDSLSPVEAAKAAGARTPEQIEALAARIAADRQPPLQSTA